MPRPSLVLISHSAKLADGLRELVEQITQGTVRVFATGGLDDQTLGTSPDRIGAILEAADSPDGVLVLMDLGSSVLAADMVVSEWPAERRQRIVLCEAPLVEGAVAAAAQLAAGGTLQEAAREARGALAPKAAQLGAAVQPAPPPVAVEVSGREVTVTVSNPMGLHARPAAQFVRAASRFAATISVRNLSHGGAPVSARSANGVALLDARQGDQIAIAASGPDAEEALRVLRELVASGFSAAEAQAEVVSAPFGPVAPAGAPNALTGIPASPGIALGPARVLKPAHIAITRGRSADPQGEWARLTGAVARAREEVGALRAQTASRAGAYAAAIFDAHLLFLEDPTLFDPVRRAIVDDHLNAEAAWQDQIDALMARYAQTANPYLQARALDIRDVGERVLHHLAGAGALVTPVLDQPAVLIAPDLTPSQTATLDVARCLALCTAGGGPTSHSAILARRLDLPAVVGLGEAVLQIADGTPLIVDGDAGAVVVSPAPEIARQYAARREAWVVHRQSVQAARLQPAATRDGHRVEVAANIGSLADAQAALEHGAEGVGLLRTEFLFLDRQTAPDEDEQVEAYRAIFTAMAPRPVIVRTFDIGGDKPAPYLALPREANPFLGWRGVRLGLERTDLFRIQLRAILRAAAGYAARVMFPMVATIDEVERVRALLEAARADVGSEAGRLDVGVMIEVPSAALSAASLARLVDFFSVGTNDLAQYTLAADRTNPKTAPLADALHPSVLRLIHEVVASAHAHGRWVGICGELGGDPVAVPILIGLGVDELSMTPPAIPEVKAIIRRLMLDDARCLAQEALTRDSAAEVRAMVRQALPAAPTPG